MSTWEMMKLWFIKETMPLMIILAILMLVFGGICIYAIVESAWFKIKRKFHRKSNATGQGRHQPYPAPDCSKEVTP